MLELKASTFSIFPILDLKDCTLNQAVWYNDISEAVLIVGRNCKESAVVSAEIIGNVEAIFHVKASHGCC